MDPEKIFGANSEILSEDVKSSLVEAWDQELNEAREEISAELREEFASRYEHDKNQIVEAMDSKLNDALAAELNEFAQDKKKLHEDRVAYKKAMREHAKVLDKFINSVLSEEITQLREDRKAQKKDVQRLEEFVLSQLTEELNGFKEDKRRLVEQRVTLMREGKKAIVEAKRNFTKRAADRINETMDNVLKRELTSLREDIQIARENEFGRKIVEAFGAEFMSSHMASGTAPAKQQQSIDRLQQQLDQAQEQLKESQEKYEEAQRRIRITEDRAARREVMAEMMQPLNSEQKEIMSGLLKTVKTKNLREAYDRYLPSVLAESGNGSSKPSQQPLNENKNTRVLTGDKRTKTTNNNGETSADIIELRRLAGVQAGNK